VTEETQSLGPVLTVVTAAFNEAKNLGLLYDRLRASLDGLKITWNWIVVDDHSADGTFGVISALAAADPRVRGLRLAHNSGSHTALTCGIRFASGRCAVVLAADLQDPPEAIAALLAKWRTGSQVVWAVRAHRPGETARTLAFARFYYWIMRRVVGLRQMPATGADFFLMDRRVIDAFRHFGEANASMLALITWMGFRQDRIEYTKEPRLHGKSGWSLQKKLKLVVDSVTSFTYAPIRLISLAGFLVAMVGFVYAGFIAFHAMTGHPVEGWSSMMIVLLVLGGFQMIFMGILGEYLWRALDEARRRPQFLIEDSTGTEGVDLGGS
jgi:glycosyltransferase involved in cell wall biosynthesis